MSNPKIYKKYIVLTSNDTPCGEAETKGELESFYYYFWD